MIDGGWLQANAMIAAARDLANHPEAQDDEIMQAIICGNYGIFLDRLTDDEVKELSRLVESFNF